MTMDTPRRIPWVDAHTRSSAQMRPSITAMKPTMPSTARKSAMGSMLVAAP